MGQELDLIKDKTKLKELLQRQIIVYGAATGGRDLKRIFDCLQIKIESFADSDSNKWNETIDSIPIISPEKMKKCYDNSVIIIASEYLQEIKHDLISGGGKKRTDLFRICCTDVYLLPFRKRNFFAQYYRRIQKRAETRARRKCKYSFFG
jgi:hypothetical protein